MANHRQTHPANNTSDMRAATERGMDQGKKGHDSFVGSAQEAASTFQEQATAVQSSA